MLLEVARFASPSCNALGPAQYSAHIFKLIDRSVVLLDLLAVFQPQLMTEVVPDDETAGAIGSWNMTWHVN